MGVTASYGEYARRVRGILERYTPIVRTASTDEYFLDFRHCEAMYRKDGDRDDDATIERVVHGLCQAIKNDLDLPASAGIGTSRPIAKMASNVAKPAGVRMVRAGEELAFAEPLPCRRWPGIGPVAEARLLEAGIHTLRDLLAQMLESDDWSQRKTAVALLRRWGKLTAQQRQRAGADPHQAVREAAAALPERRESA